eukprot:2151460-Karenia_brevis.AAC.1
MDEQPEIIRRIGLAHAAQRTIKKQVDCKGVAVAAKLDLMAGVTGSSMCWAIESHVLTNSMLQRMHSTYCKMVRGAVGFRWDGRGELVQYLVRIHSKVKHALINHRNGTVVHQIFRKQWRYFGHLARCSDDDLKFLLKLRSTNFELDNRGLHHRNPQKVLHRVSGAQKQAFDCHMHAFAQHMAWP